MAQRLYLVAARLEDQQIQMRTNDRERMALKEEAH